MGKNQSSTAPSSVDDVAFETDPNELSIEKVLEGARKIPETYLGGQLIEDNPSMHQMQQELLAFDEKLKSLFRWKTPQQSNTDYSSRDPYDSYQIQAQTSRDSGQNHDYLEPISIIGTDPTSSVSMNQSPKYLLWRCGNCMMENTIGERVCRRCGQTETRL